MYNHFEYWDGSNPRITTTNKRFFDMFVYYYCTQSGNNSFQVLGRREWNGNRTTYTGKKDILRQLAIDWQNYFADHVISMYELKEWQTFFEELGKQYGLLREFQTNGIL